MRGFISGFMGGGARGVWSGGGGVKGLALPWVDSRWVNSGSGRSEGEGGGSKGERGNGFNVF